jgi:hypothetical protein
MLLLIYVTGGEVWKTSNKKKNFSLSGQRWKEKFLYFSSRHLIWPLLSRVVNRQASKTGDTLSSRHVSSRDVTSAVGIFNIEFWRRLTLLSTLLMSRDLTWISGRLTCQHASQISVVAHISWDVTYVSSALQILSPVVSRNGGNDYWKSAPTDLFLWHQVTIL